MRFYRRLLPLVQSLWPFLLPAQAANLALLIGAILTRHTLSPTSLARLGNPRWVGLLIDWTSFDAVLPPLAGGGRRPYQVLTIAISMLHHSQEQPSIGYASAGSTYYGSALLFNTLAQSLDNRLAQTYTDCGRRQVASVDGSRRMDVGTLLLMAGLAYGFGLLWYSLIPAQVAGPVWRVLAYPFLGLYVAEAFLAPVLKFDPSFGGIHLISAIIGTIVAVVVDWAIMSVRRPTTT